MEIKKKIASLFALVGLLMFSGVFIFQLQVAFGWNNPSAVPPAGSGVLGVDPAGRAYIGGPGPFVAGGNNPTLSVYGEISAANNKITDLQSPTNPGDAVNLGYLSAAGATKGHTITVYGVGVGTLAPPNTTVSPFSVFTPGATQTFFNCLIGNYEKCSPSTFSPNPLPVGANIPAPGVGADCPTGYSSVFNGYGPYVNLEQKFYKSFNIGKQYIIGSPTGINALMYMEGDIEPAEAETKVTSYYMTDGTYAATMSICGKQTYQVAKTNYTFNTIDTYVGAVIPSKTGVGAAAGIMSACVPQKINGIDSYICNTCQICTPD